jgi:hypothetical protein
LGEKIDIIVVSDRYEKSVVENNILLGSDVQIVDFGANSEPSNSGSNIGDIDDRKT